MKMDSEFFDLETYAVYSAIIRLFGKKVWDIVWLSGEIAFAELKERLNITEKEPLAVLRRVARYLEKMGYASKLDIKKVEENKYTLDLYSTAAREGIRKLKMEQKDLGETFCPHYCTTLMFAALKEMCNMKAEVKELDFAPKEGRKYSREIWTLSKIE